MINGMHPIDETSGAAFKAAADTAAVRTRRRAASWKSTFVLFLLLGLFGAGLIAYAASAVTSVDTYGSITTTHDMSVAAPIFGGAATAALLTSLPMLGFAHLLEAQADVLDLA